MSLNVTTRTDYDDRLKAFMVSVEGQKLPVYLDTKKNPTTGWGFALNKPNVNSKALGYFLHDILGIDPDRDGLSDDAKEREEYWEKKLKDALNSSWEGKSNTDLGIKLSEVLIERREEIITGQGYTDNDRRLISTAKIDFAYDNVQQIIATFDLIKGDYDKRLDFLGANLPRDCDERVALFSAAYQGTLGVKTKKGKIIWESPERKAVKAALNLTDAEDARAEAWYAIRYLRGVDPWRAYMESALFKLYDDKSNVTAEDARAVYRMFTAHRDNILKYENTNKSQITIANSKRQLGDAVLPIEETLKEAKTALIADLYAKYDGHAAVQNRLTDPIKSVDIYLADDRGSMMVVPISLPVSKPLFLSWPSLPSGFSSASLTLGNSLMIGSDEMDIMWGGSGDDVLLGGAGHDILWGRWGNDLLCGGAGDDTYFINSNEGTDRIEDWEHGDRGDKVVINGTPITRLEGPQSIGWMDGPWESPDGKFVGRYDFVTGDYRITEVATGVQVILNENFQEGDFGIHPESCERRQERA